MVLDLLVIFFGFALSLFIYWKRLKEDYASEIIFSSYFIIVICFVVSYIVSSKFLPNWFFWMELVGVIVGFVVAIYKNRARFYESLEALVFSFIPLLGLFFLRDSVKNLSFFSFIAFVVMLVLIFVFYYVDSHYKNFIWYKSGKIGLSGLSVLFLFFVIRSTIAIFFPSVLSFSGKFEPYLSGFFAAVSLAMIISLGKDRR